MEESLEHIRESAETRMRKNAFMLHNYIELERVEKDRAVFKLDIRPESYNPYGLIHGGAIYTCFWSRAPTAVDITGDGGRLLATGEFTFFCVDKALMDQKAAAEQK